MLRFPMDETKALEALVLVVTDWPEVSAFYASKIIFLADKEHLNRFGRPVVGDRYIAMDNGPVPSAIYDWFKGNIDRMGDPQAIVDAIEFDRTGRYVKARAKRAPRLDLLSPSDVEAIQTAMVFCRGRSVSELSRYTHDDPAWQQADLNGEMNPALMIEGENREAMVQAAEEFAAYGVA